MADLFPITLADKIACVRREVAMRERVYPRRIERGMMTREQADREIAIMQSILRDLEHEEAASHMP